MASRKKPTRPVYTVTEAELIGCDMYTCKLSQFNARMRDEFCVELSKRLNGHLAHVLRRTAGSHKTYSHVVCWPGVGLFLATVTVEDVPAIKT